MSVSLCFGVALIPKVDAPGGRPDISENLLCYFLVASVLDGREAASVGGLADEGTFPVASMQTLRQDVAPSAKRSFRLTELCL